jgi:Mg-chelatase subunit ChlD
MLIVFVVDTSGSMNQQGGLGGYQGPLISLLDCAKAGEKECNILG